MCAFKLKFRKVLSSTLILVALGFMFTQCDKLDDYTPEKGPKGKDPVKAYPEKCEGQEVGFQTIQKGVNGNIEKDQNLVITKKAKWQSVWQSLGLKDPKPAIDFSQSIVLAAFQGRQHSGGHQVTIRDICATKGDFSVKVKNETPKEGCAVTTALTSPYHLIKINRSDLKHSFKSQNVNFNESTEQTCKQNNKGGNGCQPVHYKPIHQSEDGLATAKQKVIKSKAAFQRLWNSMHNNETNTPDLPDVNFQDRMVVAVFQGKKPTSGYQINVTDVCKRKSNLAVTAKVQEPGPKCATLQKITYPNQLVTVPKVQGKVDFKINRAEKSCD